MILKTIKNIKSTHHITYIKILVFTIYYLCTGHELNILTKNTSVSNLQSYNYTATPIFTFVASVLSTQRITKVHSKISPIIDVFTPSPPPPRRLTRKSLRREISLPSPPPPYPAPQCIHYTLSPTPL